MLLAIGGRQDRCGRLGVVLGESGIGGTAHGDEQDTGRGDHGYFRPSIRAVSALVDRRSLVTPRDAVPQNTVGWPREVDDSITVDCIDARLGEPQRFGTQARGMPDGAHSATGDRPGTQRRAVLGLPSWASYLANFDAGDTLPLLSCTDGLLETVPARPVD